MQLIPVKKSNYPRKGRMELSMLPPQIYVERTLAIIKPDIVDKEEEIKDIILRSGFTIVQVISRHQDHAICSLCLFLYT